MDSLNNAINFINGLLFHEYVLYILLFTGLVFTIWTGVGQWRALTHGVAVVRGKYDESNDPGAINHFQALSTALSATVGLGNIAGVGVAVALGGPGAVFWMWIIGALGMALKMTEVTQSMLFRNTSDPQNPHGGPMFVAKYGFARWGVPGVGTAIGGLFVITLLISAITGGNMFQAWNVADTTFSYFGINQLVTGVILAIVVGAVIIGGIKVIGRVASFIVPFMCAIYLIAAFWVLGKNIADVPALLGLIVKSGLPEFLGGSSAAPEGAFLGGTAGYAMMWGIKRALFSSESGQGSAPIAHSAARTDEPVREGVVAGLEPFIDTIVVCTLTALVILSSGAFNREAEATFGTGDAIAIVAGEDPGEWTIQTPPLPDKTADARRIQGIGDDERNWKDGETIFVRVQAQEDANTGRDIRKIGGTVRLDGETANVEWGTVESDTQPVLLPAADDGLGVYGEYAGSTLTAHAFDRVTPGLGKVMVSLAVWLFAISTMISWSYYGEQGVVYLFGDNKIAVLIYKVVYCAVILLTCIPGLFTTDADLDMWTSLGLGVMLIVNIPLMWIFAPQAMKAYRDYFRRHKAGPMHDEIQPDGTTPEGRSEA